VIGIVLAQPLINLVWFDHLLTLPDTREIATEWFMAEFPERTVVAKERLSIFNEVYFLDKKWPYNIIYLDDFSQPRDDLEYYFSRKVQLVVLSNFSSGQLRDNPAEEEIRLKQFDFLSENATLLKTFDPYRTDFVDWFYHDQIYAPAGETLQRVRSGPLIRVYQLPDYRQFYSLDKLDITVPVEANFANQLHLLGYDLPQTMVKAGEGFPITLYWQAAADKSPEADFIQFNHLLDSDGVLRGGYDRLPLEYYSTLLWKPGEIVVDGYAIPVDADAPAGLYYLNVGYYVTVGNSAVNLPLVVDGEITAVNSVTIGPIEVVAP
jgi:hypothetical protein